MLTLLDRRQRSTNNRPPHAPLEFGPLARFLQRRAGAVTAGFAVLAVVSVFGLRHFLKDPFEYDFRKLNASWPPPRRRSSSTRTSVTCSAAGRRRPSC
jgi:hypothetical protein